MANIIRDLVNHEMLSPREASVKYDIPYRALTKRMYTEKLTLQEAINKGKPQKQKIKKGTRFGNLVCIEQVKSAKGGNARYKMICDCTNQVEVLGISLKGGTKTSCNQQGCCYSSYVKHCLSKTHEYNVGKSLIQRCTNPNNTGYEYYG